MDIEKMSKTARQELIQTAAESIDYVAYGKTMRRDLAQRFNVPEEMVEKILRAIALNLTDAIRRM